VLPSEAMHSLVPVADLTCSLSPASMLPIALSEVLGVSLSEVMERYFNGSEEDVWVWHIEEALKHKWSEQEGEEWLAKEARRMSIDLERIHQGRDDTFWIVFVKWMGI
jgi:hypothetical protein